MKTVVSAMFASPSAAETAVTSLAGRGIDQKNISVLAPGDTVRVKSDQPINRKVAGGTVGGVLGMGAATFLVPGLGPIVGLGVLAAGLAGAGFGAAAGAVLKRSSAGVPNEDLYFYEEALRQGETVVLVETSNDDEKTRARHTLEQAGGIGIETKRREWWAKMRDRERDHAYARGVEFEPNEADYRAGFEAALHPIARGLSYDQCVAYIEQCYPEPCKRDAFRVAFDRGQQYLSGRGGREVM